MTLDTQHFKNLLEKECSVLEGELATIGRKNPENPSDWEATKPDDETSEAEEGDTAENIEQYDNNSAVLDQLEVRLNEVKSALEKIESGKYGTCEIGGEEIEEDRLKANPAAKTCILHMNE